jgi:RNA polymerase sigma-70 factor (ECF subfamily)
VSVAPRTRIDEDLVTRSAAGDRAAREELAAACLPFVWRVVHLSLGGSPDVEDVVQDAMVLAFADLPGFGGRSSFTTWLYRVALNAARGHLRRRAVRRILLFSDVLPERPGPGSAAEERTDARRLMDRLAAHLRSLRGRNREAVILSVVEGYSVSEIALVLGCGPEAAKKRLLRGRADLLDRLRRDPECRQLLTELGT